MTAIGANAFCACSNLTRVTLPDGVTTIGHSAFKSSGLAQINLPNSITSIGASAFERSKLTRIVIPDGVTFIAEGTFDMCESLTRITIPVSVTDIGKDAFDNNYLYPNTYSLTDVYYGGNAQQWAEIGIASGNKVFSSPSLTVHYNSTGN